MNLEWVGLGLALTHIQYNAMVVRSPVAYGFKIIMFAKPRKTCTDEQLKCMEVWAQANGFTFMETAQLHGDKLNRLLEVLEPFHSLMKQTDLNTIKKIRWLQENPIPKTLWRDDGTRRKVKIGRNWKKFMYWAEAWDAFCEGLE